MRHEQSPTALPCFAAALPARYRAQLGRVAGTGSRLPRLGSATLSAAAAAATCRPAVPPLASLLPQISPESATPFRKIMAANRGEIAVRIARAGIELGLTTVRLFWRRGLPGCSAQQQKQRRLQLQRSASCSQPCNQPKAPRLCRSASRPSTAAPPTPPALTLTRPASPAAPQLAIYSAADRLQPHRFKADESYQVGAPEMTPVQCYLDVQGIVEVAKRQGVDVVHPG